jgi:hypothetical protein
MRQNWPWPQRGRLLRSGCRARPRGKTLPFENDLRGTLRNFGLKVGMAGTAKFEACIKELVENLPELAALVEPLLASGGYFASNSSSCIAACSPSCGTMRCAGGRRRHTRCRVRACRHRIARVLYCRSPKEIGYAVLRSTSMGSAGSTPGCG